MPCSNTLRGFNHSNSQKSVPLVGMGVVLDSECLRRSGGLLMSCWCNNSLSDAEALAISNILYQRQGIKVGTPIFQLSKKLSSARALDFFCMSDDGCYSARYSRGCRIDQ